MVMLNDLKLYSVIINRKNIYVQTIDSDLKPYEQIRKLQQYKVKIILLDVY